MVNTITGKIWSLDTTTGIVATNPVCIHSIRVRFTTAGAGSFQMTAYRPDSASGANATQEMLLDLKTTAASTAAVYILDAQYLFGDQTFPGLVKTLCVNVDAIYVVTGVPK